ncbi:MAG TPA: DUF1501 domain-containing protein [Blastocatellia bacterium]|nr:DUF1501 domain-containing protein [Blastocatellia bacterium]
MKTNNTISRRGFIKLGATFGMLAGLGQFKLASAAPVQDYKALVCLFLAGGNDGHNVVVPLNSAQYSAYLAARGALAISSNQLLPITDPTLGTFGLHYGLPEMQALYNQGKMAILANVGGLVQPTTFQNLSNPGFPLPTNLRSHSDQVTQMQTGVTDASGSTGWGGRTLDTMQASNAGTTFPVSIAMNAPAIFCAGATVKGIALQPGDDLTQNALTIYPPTAAQARATAQQQIINADSGNSMINAANQSMISAVALNPLLKNAASTVTWTKPFPQTSLGSQLQDIANIISLNSQLNVGRQVFFCSLGGFDTHSGQSWQQWDLLIQVSQALDAFYAATTQLGLDSQVTTFTLSDFGRTLQPNATGTDHGWGNHHLILGGAVAGGRIYGTFPKMTNYANFNATNSDFADTRGVMLPNTSLSQYGATLAKWFGATDQQVLGLFQSLSNFSVHDIGFMG